VHSPVTFEILSLFQTYGHTEYGERVTQNAHAIQAGLLALEKGYDDELIVAAFLHDIGHLYPLDLKGAAFSKMGDFGLEAHDKWGEHFLKERNFSDRIIATVRNHVDAKRYLCFADSDYYDRLSNASKETLRYQGGPMDKEEANHFVTDPFFDDSIRIRRIDEEAKEQDFVVQKVHWDYFAELLDQITKS